MAFDLVACELLDAGFVLDFPPTAERPSWSGCTGRSPRPAGAPRTCGGSSGEHRQSRFDGSGPLESGEALPDGRHRLIVAIPTLASPPPPPPPARRPPPAGRGCFGAWWRFSPGRSS